MPPSGSGLPAGPFVARAFQLAWRGLRRRCPNCGGGPLFRTWFRMVTSCPRCGLALERHEDGYLVGAMMFNIAAAELVFVVLLVGVLVVTWPDPPWEWLTWGSAATMVLLPIAFYPFSKTLFLAFDLLFHPVAESDLRPPREPPAT